MNETAYGRRVFECLNDALAADEKWLRRQSLENGIWSIRQYEECWLQYLVLRKSAGRSDFALAPEHRTRSFGDRRPVDLLVYGKKEKLIAAIELKGPWLVKSPRTKSQETREVLELQARRAGRCRELWVFFLLHASEKRKIDDWQQDARTCVAKSDIISKDIPMNQDSPRRREIDPKTSTVLRIVGMRVFN